VIAAGQILRDLKVARKERHSMAEFVMNLEKQRDGPDGWEHYPMSFSVGDLEIDGTLLSIERTTENGEEIIVFRI
jgi:hypothetical protein